MKGAFVLERLQAADIRVPELRGVCSFRNYESRQFEALGWKTPDSSFTLLCVLAPTYKTTAYKKAHTYIDIYICVRVYSLRV